MKKIIAISTSRSELGLQTNLYNELALSKRIKFIPIITGDNLNNNKFNDIKNIKSKNLKKIQYNRKYKNNYSLITSISNIIKITDILEKLKPDMIVVMGDRYEIFYICSIAFILKIPICHLSGGDTTLGSLDDTFRHSISLMSNLHLVATKSSKKKLLQLGIKDTSIKIVGEIGLQNINNFKFFNLNDISKKLKVKLTKNIILLAFHPETLTNNTTFLIKNILKSLNHFDEHIIIATSSNNDPGGNTINKILIERSQKYKKFLFFENLGRELFLSLLKNSSLIIGNSSSGIVEAPSLNTYSIDIGDRQKGRERAESVYHSKGSINDIKLKIKKCLNLNNKSNSKNFKNPYEKKDSLSKCLKYIIKNNV